MSTTLPIGAAPLPEVLPPLRQRGRILTFIRRHPAIMVGGTLLGAMVFIAIFAPWLGTTDPTAIAPAKRIRDPSALYWMGTDMLGRDVYSRVMYGARISLGVGFSVAVVSVVVGTLIGAVAGFIRGLDSIIMRVMDGLMSIPPILLAIALMALTRASVQNVIIALSVPEFPRIARLVRGIVLQLREQPFVEGAIAAGTRLPRIIWRHILPNAFAVLLVQATFTGASAMINEAILSFIGAGTPPTIPSWGNIMAEGRVQFVEFPHNVFFPGVVLAVTVLAVNILGDGL
ncbi:MAG: ABC transporter permease, partial [Acetobacteraceae bacterium]